MARVADVPALRPIRPADHAEVLALNEKNESLLAPMDEDRLAVLLRLADRADIVDVDGAFGGFVLTFAPGTTYDSANYRWFTDRHGDRFYYLDRIVLHPEYRRRGLGMLVYDEIELAARTYGRMCLEVNVEPANAASLSFHQRRGYVEVGRLGEDGHRVSMLEKDL